MMPRFLPPLRPKRHDAESLLERLRTPDANSNTADVSAALPVKPEPAPTPPMPAVELPRAQPMQEQPSYTNRTTGQDSPSQPNENTMWPSEIYGQCGTMWLLPPYADQSSAIAMLLQTEIQAHNVTREMLHTTEQRRLEAVQNSNRLQTDVRNWSAAHENLVMVFGKCSEELSRLQAENEKLSQRLERNVYNDASASRWISHDNCASFASGIEGS